MAYKFKSHISLLDIGKLLKFRFFYRKEHPLELTNIGLTIFCGEQGSGKTLSAVRYVSELMEAYPRAILCTNVHLRDYPINCKLAKNEEGEYGLLGNNGEFSLFNDYCGEYRVCDYTGHDCLSHLSNGEYGVIYLIDEIHLEWLNLDKNVSVEEMIEFSQQRKQRKHIIGTSQVFMRINKALREQINTVIACKCFLGLLSYNTYFKGWECEEKDGKIVTTKARHYFFTHNPSLYNAYDTYAKMRRIGAGGVLQLMGGNTNVES